MSSNINISDNPISVNNLATFLEEDVPEGSEMAYE